MLGGHVAHVGLVSGRDERPWAVCATGWSVPIGTSAEPSGVRHWPRPTSGTPGSADRWSLPPGELPRILTSDGDDIELLASFAAHAERLTVLVV